MRHPLTRLLSFTGLLACLSTSAWAEAVPQQTLPKYKVEVIVFQTLALKGWTEEFWPYPTELLEPEDSDISLEVALTEEPPEENNTTEVIAQPIQNDVLQASELIPVQEEKLPPPNYQFPTLLTEADYQLNEEAGKMTPRRGYQILLHQAWEMTGYPQEQAMPLKLEVLAQNRNDSGLEGELIFYKSRYAHIAFDLELERKIPSRIREAFAEHERLDLTMLPDFWRFQLKEKRKIKSGELHYLDHPIFGVLVKMQYIKGSMRDLTEEELEAATQESTTPP